MAKLQYPNPKFFKARDNIDWKKQGENLKEVAGIFAGMLKETDWKQFARDSLNVLRSDGERVKGEFSDFMALPAAEKWDRVVNGERSLGRLYRKGAMCTVRREWRGVADTAYDFFEWARMWGMLLATFSKDLVPALNSALWYRWMISYFCCHGFMDKNLMGLRGSNLRMSHAATYAIFRYVAENLVLLSKADRKNGNSDELNKMLFTFDEMTMGQIAAGFPDLLAIPHQLLPMFLVSEIDQLVCIPYIDAVESYGLPSDTCPVPSSECGALVIDALPDMGSLFISSSMPCDGSTMASSYFARRFPDTPVFHLCFPVRYLDEETVQMGAEDIRACIRAIEDATGAKWNWEHYFECMRRFNQETDLELQKWEINRSSRPQFIGPSYELFRKWNYEMDGGIDPRVLPEMQKMNRMLQRAYEKGETAWPKRKITTPTSPTGWPTAGASTSSSRWNRSTTPSTSRPRTRKRRCATWPACTSAWSCAATPTAATRTSWTSAGASARPGTRSSSSCTRTSPARTWPPSRACWTNRAAPAATTSSGSSTT